MEIRKASWQSSADQLHLAMPFTKVDEQKRQVHGFASLDNIDEHDDVVQADASSRAFARFRGNIREMHQPIAAGRMLDFYEDVYYDAAAGEFHKGIVVTAYISTGAESTWQKVLDGTLSGFSIGGNIIDSETEFDKAAGKPVRFIKEYELYELSLVDNPANQLANIFSVEKSKDGTPMFKGLAVEVQIENVFYCKTDEIAKTSTEESLDCPGCGESMENAGWIESNGADKETSIVGTVEKYLSKQAEPANNEGGVDVAENKNEGLPEAGSAVPAGETEAVEQGKAETEATASVETEEAANVSEVDDSENSLEKMLSDLQESISKSLEDNAKSVNESIEEIQTSFTKSFGEVEEKISTLASKHEELTSKFADLKNQIGDVEKSVTGLEQATAIKKSSDLGGSVEEETKKTGLWGGAFLSVDSLQ